MFAAGVCGGSNVVLTNGCSMKVQNKVLHFAVSVKSGLLSKELYNVNNRQKYYVIQ